MNKRILTIVIACFLFSSPVYSQIQDKAVEERRKKETTDIIIDQIVEKLGRLDKQYLTKLNRLDYRRSIEILDDIYFLLSIIPVRDPVEPIYDPPVIEIFPLSEEEFSSLSSAIKNESFEENKLNVVEIAVRSSFFTIDQVIRLVDLITYSAGKIKTVELTYPKVVDKYNAHLLFNAFTYSSDKEKLKEIINRHGQ